MSNYRFNRMAPAAFFMVTLVFSVAVIATLPGTLHAADPGRNQPGAAGNVGRDPGINQPGAPGVDPGINQPGAAGNVGNRPGVRR